MDHDGRPQREAPTREEALRFAAGFAPDEAAALLARTRPAAGPRARSSRFGCRTAGVRVVGGLPGPDHSGSKDGMVPQEGHAGQQVTPDVRGA